MEMDKASKIQCLSASTSSSAVSSPNLLSFERELWMNCFIQAVILKTLVYYSSPALIRDLAMLFLGYSAAL